MQPLAQVRAAPLAHVDSDSEVMLVWFRADHPAAPAPAAGAADGLKSGNPAMQPQPAAPKSHATPQAEPREPAAPPTHGEPAPLPAQQTAAAEKPGGRQSVQAAEAVPPAVTVPAEGQP